MFHLNCSAQLWMLLANLTCFTDSAQEFNSFHWQKESTSLKAHLFLVWSQPQQTRLWLPTVCTNWAMSPPLSRCTYLTASYDPHCRASLYCAVRRHSNQLSTELFRHQQAGLLCMVGDNDDVISYKLMSTMGNADVKVYKCTLLNTQQYAFKVASYTWPIHFIISSDRSL